MPRPEHPHIQEIKDWIGRDIANPSRYVHSGSVYHEAAVQKWGAIDAPALRTIANALREVRGEADISVESEPLTAGECPECLGYGHFWMGLFLMRGDSQVWKSTAKSHGGPLTTHQLAMLAEGVQNNAFAKGKVVCGSCTGTGYIGTPATRIPEWEVTVTDELAQLDDTMAEAKETLKELVEISSEAPDLKPVADSLADAIVNELVNELDADMDTIITDDVANRMMPPLVTIDIDLEGMDMPEMPDFIHTDGTQA